MDPGFTWTTIHSSQVPAPIGWLIWMFGPLLGATSPSNACMTPLWLAGGGGTGRSGEHWYDCNPSEKVDPQAEDEELRARVWDSSLRHIEDALNTK